MKLNDLGKLVIEQAKEKGWGHTKEMLVVSEKMMLINTEISELYEALGKEQHSAKDTVESEAAGVLVRVLHLGLAWGINFDAKKEFKSRLKGIEKGRATPAGFLYLHSLASAAYDDYRHKIYAGFLKNLFELAREMIEMGRILDVDLESAVKKKLEINKSRSWSGKDLQGTYYK